MLPQLLQKLFKYALQVRDQANQLTKLQAESQLLESSLQDSQRQAMALGTRLTLTENKNDELIGQTQVGASWALPLSHGAVSCDYVTLLHIDLPL
jgi:hypothetical protein